MIKNGNEYHAFFGMFETTKPIYFAKSADGLLWYVNSDPLLEVGDPTDWDDGFLYRACGVPITGGYTLWYTGNSDGSSWVDCHIGKTTVTLS